MPRNPVCNINICVLWLGNPRAQRKGFFSFLSDWIWVYRASMPHCRRWVSVWEACLHHCIPCAIDTTNERQHYVSCNPTFLKPITLQPFCFMFLWSCDPCKNIGSLNIHHGLFMWAANKTSDLQLCFPLGWLWGLGCVTAYILAQCKHLIRLISENPM
jgi:hypothetical protein